ncbi:MAG: hypothetical protein ACP5IL_02940 [Syntrophobacteraceae bacterium]
MDFWTGFFLGYFGCLVSVVLALVAGSLMRDKTKDFDLELGTDPKEAAELIRLLSN